MKMLKRFSVPLLLFGVMLCYITILKLRGDGAEAQQSKYVPQVLISAPWGGNI